MSARIAILLICCFGLTANGQVLPNLYPFPNASGWVATYNTENKPIDLTGPFY